MQLLTNALRQSLPPLGGSDAYDEPLARVKFFTPDGSWAWYASEFDGHRTFYGLVDGLELEFGCFSLAELESVRGHLGLPVERDRYFTPVPLDQLYKELSKGRNVPF
jgi:hypothetical protein